MKEFFKFMFASMLGFIISGIILIFVFVGVLVGTLSTSFESAKNKVEKIDDNAVLHLTLDKPIVDRASEYDFDFNFSGFKSKGSLGLNKILEHIEKAKEDEKIKGIYLELSGISAGMATMEEIRNALIDFKESGKWIISYAENYNIGTYYMASVADEIYVYPEGGLDFRGLYTELTFLKGTLEKLDIEPQIIRGPDNKYKSAIEPLIYDEMSDANREQLEAIVNNIWEHMLARISEQQGIPVSDLDTIAQEVLIRQPEDAVKYGLATKTMYKDELLELLRTKLELESDEEINFVSLKEYFRTPSLKTTAEIKETLKSGGKRNKIAVVYAIGSIESGEGDSETIGSERISEAIREARLDTTIKAIVLRVNSPGGSALASDVIWRETILAKEAKPLVVSMGDVAASGGYYISCAADKILAMPNTITGSIGVFGVIPNMKGFFNDKLGMTFDGVKTNKYADMMTVTRPLEDDEMAIIEESVSEIYDEFVNKVADGRGLSPLKVDEIARGRVWTGSDALAIGLIDEIGGLNAAIDAAKELADLEDYAIEEFPEEEDPFKEMMEELTGQAQLWAAEVVLGEDARLLKRFEQVQQARSLEGIQMLMPYSIEIK